MRRPWSGPTTGSGIGADGRAGADMVPFGDPMQIASDAPATFRSSARRPRTLELLTTAFREVMSRRRLIRYLVGAEIKKKGTDTVLGNVWWILDPLLSLMVYVFVMTIVFARNQVDFAVFLLAAMIPFKWFTQTLSDSVAAVVMQAQLIKQIQFPKIVLPIVTNGAGLVNLAFGMGVLFAVVIVLFPAHMSYMIVFVPLIAAIQFVLMLGLSMFVSALTVFYRDIGIIIGHVLRLLFYVAPILWTFESAGGRGAILHKELGEVGFSLLRYNPVAVLLEAYRTCIYGVTVGESWVPASPSNLGFGSLIAVFLFSVVLLVLGTLVFKRLEPAFAKVL
jgi:lipopolysaccharide transport system permease protein